MNHSIAIYHRGGLIGIVLLMLLSSPVQASVIYRFVVTGQPSGDFFKPMTAQMVLSNDAVAAGLARKGQIESVVVSGGPTMQEANRITLTYLHSDFKDLTVTLSPDRSTVSAISATLSTNGATIDHWVFHYQHPEYPSLDIHEFLGYIRPDSVTLETTILPVPPTTHVDRFDGHWQRVRTCWLCPYPYFPIKKWYICWFDWIVVGTLIIITIAVVWRWRRRKNQESV